MNDQQILSKATELEVGKFVKNRELVCIKKRKNLSQNTLKTTKIF